MKNTAAALSLVAALSACDEKIDTATCIVDTSDPNNITATITDNFLGATIAEASHLRAQPDGTYSNYEVSPKGYIIRNPTSSVHDGLIVVKQESSTCELVADYPNSAKKQIFAWDME